MKRALQKGFTLIELVVVIVILGILAAVAVPQFTDLSTSARQAVADSACGAVQSAAVILYASNKAGSSLNTIIQSVTTSGVVLSAGPGSCTAAAQPSGSPAAINCPTAVPSPLCT